MLAILVLGASWWLYSALGTPIDRTSLERAHNAQVLSQAKAALIGYVAHKAATTGENDPGSLPCPEAAGNVGTADEGIAAGNCTQPVVGRLPWRTLGLPKLFDASGEPLWYVVSPGWAKPNATTHTVINSNSTGQLVLDAATGIVALILAPGRPLVVQASANCTARNQARTTPSSTIDFRDYLECRNANSPADNTFETSGADGSFNDQVLAVTSLELLPGIEAAVASRFAREFGPQMRYCDGLWPACTSAAYLPFAATLTDPAFSNFQGALNTTQGLLPVSFSATGGCVTRAPPFAHFCDPPTACTTGSDNRCARTLVTYRNNPVITKTGGPSVTLLSSSCSVAGTPSTLTCVLKTYFPVTSASADRWMTFTMDVTSNNVGMAVRKINAAVQLTGVDTDVATAVNYPYGYAVTALTMNADGSATMRISSRLPPPIGGGLITDLLCGISGFLGLFNDCGEYTIAVPFMWTDDLRLHASNADFGWFPRNGWHQLAAYAVSANNVPGGSGSCVAGTNCLSVNAASVTAANRAVLIMTGRALTQAPYTQNRPGAVGDWVEGGNANLPSASVFWARHPTLPVHRGFNDHVVAIDTN